MESIAGEINFNQTNNLFLFLNFDIFIEFLQFFVNSVEIQHFCTQIKPFV